MISKNATKNKKIIFNMLSSNLLIINRKLLKYMVIISDTSYCLYLSLKWQKTAFNVRLHLKFVELTTK